MSKNNHLCDITEMVIKPLKESIYMKPASMLFKHNGIDRKWDLLEVHDSVAAIIYNLTKNSLVFVKQFRPAVYYSLLDKEDKLGVVDLKKYPLEKGVTIELCAGIVDKDLSLEEIAKEEILEECGYKVDKIELVASYRSGVGHQGSKQCMYYCEVTDDMKVHSGGGVNDENIEVIEMSLNEVLDYIKGSDIVSPPSFLFGVYWFLINKAKK